MENTDVPYFSVRAIPEGKSARPIDLTGKILEFEFVDEEAKADKLVLRIENEDLSEFDNPIWRKGVILEATWGYRHRVGPSRRCVIRKIGGGRVLNVEAHALSSLMHTDKKARVWKNMTLSEIATRIAADYTEIREAEEVARQENKERALVPAGVAAEDWYNLGNISVPAEYDQRIERRVQAAETDAAFLARLARKHGLVFYVDNQGVHFKMRNLKQPPVKTLTWRGGNGDFLDFNVENDISGKAGSVTKKGFDPLNKKALTHQANNASTKRDGLANVVEIVDKRTGATHLASRASEDHVEHTNEVTPSGVKSHASGKFRENQHTAVKMTCTVIGDPMLLGKRVVELQGLGKRLSGRYYVSQATHKIGSGYRVTLKCKTDGTGGYHEMNIKSEATKSGAVGGAGGSGKTSVVERVDARTATTRLEYRRDGEER